MVLKTLLPKLNLLLIVVASGFLILAVFNFFTFEKRFSIENLKTETPGKDLVDTQAPAIAFGSLESYKQLFSSKRLFRPLIKRSVKTQEVLTIDDLTRDLILIGVVQQESPEAIIKNRRTRQTYFVKKGAALGQLKVEEVGEDKIVVSYQNTNKTMFIQ